MYRYSSGMMKSLWSLLVLSIVGCGISRKEQGFSLSIVPSKDTYLLSEKQNFVLNCTGYLKRITGYNDDNKMFQLKIKDNNGVVCNRSQFTWIHEMLNDEYKKTVSCSVNYEFNQQIKIFTCLLEDNMIMVYRTTSVVFTNPPEAPVNISNVFLQDKLFIFDITPYNKLVRKMLHIEYAIRFRGDGLCSTPFKSKWMASANCVVYDRKSHPDVSMLTCVVGKLTSLLGNCKRYQVILLISNKFGNTKSRTFVIQRDFRYEVPLARITLIHQTSNELKLILNHNVDVTYLHEIFYTVKYKTVSSTAITKVTAYKGNGKYLSAVLHNLLPNQCYEISTNVEIIISPRHAVQHTQSKIYVYCTQPLRIIHRPENFICFEKDRSTEHEPAVTQLTWTMPQLGKKFGIISHYQFTSRFEKYIDNELHTFLCNTTINLTTHGGKFLQRKYYTAGRTYYNISACNVIGCSHNNSQCDVLLQGALNHDDETHQLSLPMLLSCIVPTFAILLLVIAAFFSYYRKIEIIRDLTVPLVHEETNDAIESGRKCCSSQSSDAGVQVQENDTKENKNTYVDEDLTAINKTELAKLFVNALTKKNENF